MPKREELTVITKTYDLILWSCNHTSRFPRSHRFVFCERIERNLYELLRDPAAGKIPTRTIRPAGYSQFEAGNPAFSDAAGQGLAVRQAQQLPVRQQGD